MSNYKYKYTDDEVKQAVKVSISLADVLRKLNIKLGGGNLKNIKNRILKLNLDTSHFLGQKSNSGIRHKGGRKELNLNDIFVYDRQNKRKEKSYILRNAMKKYGFIYKCSICEINPIWNEKELKLEVDHINGDFLDNRIENLRFVCPNCHSQLATSTSSAPIP